MIITSRDLDIFDFLEEYRIASTSTLTALFFPSLKYAQKRLKMLFDAGRLKRARLTMNHDYIYYLKKPGNYMHDLLRTEFYRYLYLNSRIINFVSEKQISNIRPDAIFAYEVNGKQRLGLLEVEISNKGLDTDKYDIFYSSGEYKRYFPSMPPIYIVARKPKKLISNVNFIFIDTDFSNFKLLEV